MLDYWTPIWYYIITERKTEVNKMKEYTVNYREKGNKEGQVFETSVTANNLEEAREYAKQDLDDCYVIVKVRLA